MNDPHFRKLDIIDDDLYEVSRTKKSVTMNLPIQIGFFVYQYAKLRMLQFYYDFMDKFIDRSDFEYCEIDTDSAYVPLSGESVDDLIKPELRAEYEQEKHVGFRANITRKFVHLTNVPRGYLRPNSRAMELFGSAAKCIFVLMIRKLSSAVRGLTSTRMRSTKTPIGVFFAQKRQAPQQTEVFALGGTGFSLAHR